MGAGGPLREHEEKRFRRFVEEVHGVYRVIEDTRHVFIKLRRPVVYVPADIDVLIDREDVSTAVYRLVVKRGYRVLVRDLYTVTLGRGPVIVDLYTEPTVGDMVYISRESLMRHREYVDMGGLEIPVLEKSAEAVLATAHAVYKERIYTLNDYVTTREWLGPQALRIAVETLSLDPVIYALETNYMVERGLATLPQRVSLLRWGLYMARKTARDRVSRATVLNILKRLFEKRTGRALLERLSRESY